MAGRPGRSRHGAWPRRIAVPLVLLLSSVGVPVAAQEKSVNQRIDTLLGNQGRYEQVIRSFQTAVVYADADSAAKLVRYPLRVTIGGKSSMIGSAQEFVRNYDRIVTPAIATVIANQKYDELLVNAQGVMFGSGQVWVNGVCVDVSCRRVDVKVAAIQDVAK